MKRLCRTSEHRAIMRPGAAATRRFPYMSISSMTVVVTVLLLAMADAPARATHVDAVPFVPLMAETHPDLTQTMYAERASLQFVVYDCTSSRPLWEEANNAASTWNIDAPIDLQLRLEESACEGSTTNTTNEIYFTQESFRGSEVGDHHYRTADGRILAEDLRVSLPDVPSQARSLNTSTQIVIFNQLMNGFGHVLGLDDVEAGDVEHCHGSVMLGNCRIQRAMPAAADRAAIAHLYGTDPERHADLRRFDTNGNDLIDDPEFRAALNQWIQGRVTDELFLELVEVWSRNKSISGLAMPLGSPTVSATALRVFDLGGRLIVDEPCRSTNAQRRAQLALDRRLTVPPGAYLAVVRDCDTGVRDRRVIVKLP